MVRALCTRQIGPGLHLEGDAVYELLLVPSLAPSDFSQGPAIFPSPKKTSLLITNDQAALLPFFLEENERPISSYISKFQFDLLSVPRVLSKDT